MDVETNVDEGSDWKRIVRRHWVIISVLVAACVIAAIGAVYVFLWFVTYAQSTGLVPSSLALWSMASVVTFILNTIFWELLLVGVPVVIGVLVVWMWWHRLPEEERREYRFRRSRTTGGSGGVSLFFFAAFCVKVYLDGNWNVPVAAFTLNYVVGSMLLILEWTAVLVGIPLAIGLAWWIRHESKNA